MEGTLFCLCPPGSRLEIEIEIEDLEGTDDRGVQLMCCLVVAGGSRNTDPTLQLPVSSAVCGKTNEGDCREKGSQTREDVDGRHWTAKRSSHDDNTIQPLWFPLLGADLGAQIRRCLSRLGSTHLPLSRLRYSVGSKQPSPGGRANRGLRKYHRPATGRVLTRQGPAYVKQQCRCC